MSTETISEMTRAELETLITQIVKRRTKGKTLYERSGETRSLEELMEEADRNRIVPRPGTPSTLELLREDRDR